MERLIIDVPDKKSALVKQLLTELGVLINEEKKKSVAEYRKGLLKISVWSDEDLKVIEDSKAFEDLKPQKW